MMNQKNLSNDLLKKIANDLDVCEIDWYSPEGAIIYTNIDRYLGWKPLKEHPVENFRISGKIEYMEGIRMDTESFNMINSSDKKVGEEEGKTRNAYHQKTL